MNWLILTLMLLGSAFFSSSETALTALSRSKIRQLLDDKVKGAKALDRLTRDPAKMLTTILVGNNITNVAVSVLATELMFGLLESQLHFTLAIMASITTGVITLVLLLFGEVTPKNFAIHRAEKIAPLVAPVILFWGLILSPIVFLLNLVSKGLVLLVAGRLPDQGGLVTPEEIQAMVSLGESQGVIEEEEKEMIHSIIEFGDLIVKEIMIPRADIIAIEMKDDLNRVVQTIRDKGHSRIPVYNAKLDNIIGIIHAKDVLNHMAMASKQLPSIGNLSSLVRPAHFIPENKNVAELFQYMRAFKNHIAIAVDEYGAVSGLVTLEDIIEEIVGDIHDEFDTDLDQDVLETGSNYFLLKATTDIEKLNKLLGSQIPEDPSYESLGGFVFSLFGSIPTKGDTKQYENLLFKVEEVKSRRIMKVRVTKL